MMMIIIIIVLAIKTIAKRCKVINNKEQVNTRTPIEQSNPLYRRAMQIDVSSLKITRKVNITSITRSTIVTMRQKKSSINSNSSKKEKINGNNNNNNNMMVKEKKKKTMKILITMNKTRN